jgi:hypothetical protein
VSYFVAALFRVKLELLKTSAPRHAVSGVFHMTLFTVARDAESAAVATRRAMSERTGRVAFEDTRTVSVEFVECVNVLGLAAAEAEDRYLSRRRGRPPSGGAAAPARGGGTTSGAARASA